MVSNPHQLINLNRLQRFPEPLKVSHSRSVGYTMVKTVDLTDVHKIVTDTLHGEGKLVVHRVLYPGILTEN